ncbi:hypothetical protein M378DRAFT_297736 [Amanita muscaria Koide BX008]|uniref:Uncharacterized protein n=1 Tax=Amanita muscaria (strain Koide BX008) TaxID=946122 RepID=A0A0C2TJN7_AMAMK|nr:hypothetical protein M378DRAFT_297736 [Amanita muscaria Koide BX008]
MPKARLSPAERQERRRAACAKYNAKNAETLRAKSRERMRKLRASRKEAIKVVDKQVLVPVKVRSLQDLRKLSYLSSLILKGILLIAVVQKKVGKFALKKAAMKVEDDLSYDADSEGSEEE